ncbi:ATP-binding protein [Aliiglaciecola sp. LCG003]|uniref:ATP-binding protein n=1 Tax=Aliiglaciecola sp. LCG003 TaxID=3053655 RepID=UPI002573EA3E|nr:ATP-binding protein [Aliiglaciecola sp. LCG003]WJG09412.1 ATP-binding protein [Aliiglaciecola sp. LCG003]
MKSHLRKGKALIWTPLQIKIFVLVVSLFSLVFTLTLVSVYNAAYNQAERQFLSRLNVGRNVFLNEIANAKSQLDVNVETISKDWALRSAIGTAEDTESIRTVLFNFGNRIEADIALVLDKDFMLITQYGGQDDDIAQALGRRLSQSQQQRAWIAMVANEPYLVSAEPIRAPGIIGWLIMGKKLNLSLLARIKTLISLDINLAVVTGDTSVVPLSSAQNDPMMVEKIQQTSLMLPDQRRPIEFQTVDARETVLLPFVLFEDEQHQFVVVLQDSIQVWLKTLREFMLELLPFFLVGVLLAVLGSYYIARSITRPVGRLLDAAKRVASGQYSETIEISGKSELGELAHEFAAMQHAVMIREQKIKDQAEEIRQTNKAKYQIEIIQKEQQLAASANEAKNRFLANVSHEIRTPLNSIIGYSEMLSDQHASQQQIHQATLAINHSGHYLLNIVNDVLDLSKIEAGKIQLDRADVCLVSLLNEVCSYMRGFAEEKNLQFGLQLHYPLPQYCNIDGTRLKQILLNLCNNAIKFTAQGRVDLQVYLDNSKGRFIFVVSDTGLGMSEEQQLRLFTAFSQGNQAINRKYGGTGLGLHISKQLIEMMGGHIKVTSQEGIGSQFAVYLPWTPAQDERMLTCEQQVDWIAQHQHSHDLAVPQINGRILVVDDNEDNRLLVAYLLAKTGAHFSLAEGGKAALELAGKEQFDLILMDMQMPDMDGLQATGKLLEQGFTKPIIMLTANVDNESIKQVEEVGATAHFAKPINSERFYKLLEQFMVIDVQPHGMVGDAPVGEGYAKLTQQYTASFEDKIIQFRAALSEQNWPILKELLHKLKGSAGSYGFDHISDLAEEIEDALQQNNIPSVNVLMSKMFSDMARAAD